MKKSMIYRVLIYIAGLLILAMESYRRFRIVFTEVSDLRRTVLMCSTCLVCTGRLHGIGIGTVLAVILVGRTIAVFNHFTKEKLTALAGIEE